MVEMAFKKQLSMVSFKIDRPYRYRDRFQISPPPENALQPPNSFTAQYPAIFELKYEKPPNSRVVRNKLLISHIQLESEVIEKIAKELRLVLSVISRYQFFIHKYHQSWFMPSHEDGQDMAKAQSLWGQEMYFYPNLTLDGEGFSSLQGAVDTVDPNGYYRDYMVIGDDKFELANNTTELLDTFYLLSEIEKECFLSAASLFQQGLQLWHEHPSLSFASFISALETLSNFENKGIKNEHCPHCKLEILKVSAKFRTFMKKFCGSSPDFIKFSTKAYDRRCKILHTGKLFFGEIEIYKFGEFNGLEENMIRRSIINPTRICLVNWLKSKNQLPH